MGQIGSIKETIKGLISALNEQERIIKKQKINLWELLKDFGFDDADSGDWEPDLPPKLEGPAHETVSSNASLSSGTDTASADGMPHIPSPKEDLAKSVRAILEERLETHGQEAVSIREIASALQAKGYYSDAPIERAAIRLSSLLSRSDGFYSLGKKTGWSLHPPANEDIDEKDEHPLEQLMIVARHVYDELSENEKRISSENIAAGAIGLPANIDGKLLARARSLYQRILTDNERKNLRASLQDLLEREKI